MKNPLQSLKSEIKRKWKPRKSEDHKGYFGRVFIVAGAPGFTGAAHLAGLGALRGGAGLVTLGVPQSVYSLIAKREKEIMVRPFASTPKGSLSFRALNSVTRFLDTQNVLAIGPGLSLNSGTQKLIRSVLARTKKPVVIDADGLNACVGHLKILKACKAEKILTPHMGEFLRLFGGPVIATETERAQRAKEIAQTHRLVLVLKGHRTVIATPEGQVYVNPTGNPGMASGGTGDVLTGMIAALLGQGFSAADAARFAVFFHGSAGDLAAKKMGQVSLIASDLIDYLPQAFKNVLKF